MPDAAGEAPGSAVDAATDGGERWRAARRYLNAHRRDLAVVAAELYPELVHVAGTPLLARAEWILGEPVALDAIELGWQLDAPPPLLSGSEPESSGVRPVRSDGGRYAGYVDALAALDPPRLLANRRTYRLLDVDLSTPGGGRMVFGRGSYFDIINICEAVAHELAGHRSRHPASHAERERLRELLPFRALIGDPTDPRRRPLLPAISTLTLRRDPADRRRATFVLHWRDPARVASGGGLYQVAPVGVFQPSDDADWNELNDLDPWRSMVREYAEEFLGAVEDYGSDATAIDYERWPLYRRLAAARREGRLRVSCVGLGVDALTLVTDLLTVAVFDAPVFDDMFAGIVTDNEEGSSTLGVPFDADSVKRYAGVEPMQPAGAALLRLAWRHRDRLLA